jgi:GT2 family glycosyltransferase
VRIDGARGCNWACRREWFERAGGFDPAFQGTALREETDLYLRLGKLGAVGYYNANARVIHHRQAGGCENLAASLTSLRSKLENEYYFQNKHFPSVSRLWFLLRTAPLMLETLIESRGMSLLLWIRYGSMRR